MGKGGQKDARPPCCEELGRGLEEGTVSRLADGSFARVVRVEDPHTSNYPTKGMYYPIERCPYCGKAPN